MTRSRRLTDIIDFGGYLFDEGTADRQFLVELSIGQDHLVQRDVRIVNRQGLHARPVMRFVDLAYQFQSSITVRKGDLSVDGKTYHYFSLPEAAKSIGDISRLPYSLKVLLENVLRFEDGRSYTVDDAKKIAEWVKEIVTPAEPD